MCNIQCFLLHECYISYMNQITIFKYGRLKVSTYICAYTTSENAKVAFISPKEDDCIYVKG